MIRKVLHSISNLLLLWGYRLKAVDSRREYQNRLLSVKQFLHEYLPVVRPEFANRTIIEGGTYNFFELPGGGLPKVEFFYPELPLFVCVWDVRSASWEEARLSGISRTEWESFQADAAMIRRELSGMSNLGKLAKNRVWIVDWSKPVEKYSLYDQIETLLVD